MVWQIKIHRLVVEEDFKKLDPPIKNKILKDIKKKLSSNPDQYGEPLKGPFKMYWKLRVGDYRVIYEMLKDKIVVLVIKVGIRKDFEVYKELFSRLNKL